MTKEEAWVQFESTLIESDRDGVKGKLPADYPSEDDVSDAFNWGWDCALESLKASVSPKELKEAAIPFAAIIIMLNRITGRTFKNSETHRKRIRARWNEGFRENDFEKVVAIMNEHWQNDDKMSMFLRPETLFGTKMDSYLNIKLKAKAEIEDWQ
jgi:uncharacterized phage protein (TIGR02220 family)